MVLCARIDVLPLPINPPNVTGAQGRRGMLAALDTCESGEIRSEVFIFGVFLQYFSKSFNGKSFLSRAMAREGLLQAWNVLSLDP